ncbi:MAG: 3-deoxy-manno-octulosonate cytidylyltransferase [Gammaproteobacteria bacterium]|nr:3-deoxy-manno-octulosonate cytidylyltransferase [Gammaproteobacteria bacterium]NNC98409.1 3-deoxy-manno-octulosonate cytidylyltransferase [Gammaproteobacteria bacterium]NNM13885.1 3-deoxy-manno-octulosonate cytidylyltransferase [Gammaproteobacteria bacterium]
MNYKLVIPARYDSQRLPGKPLKLIHGRTMIERVIDKALASNASEVIVATDDERIAKAVKDSGVKCFMTSKDHQNGTERITEVALKQGWDAETLVVNLQGDEPLMVPALLDQVAGLLDSDPAAAMATLCLPFHDQENLANPNVVKVVFNKQQYAQYFSRAPIPFPRDTKKFLAYRHLGLYAYRVKTLKKLITLRPTEHEQTEKLEQLRALDNGLLIKIATANGVPGHGVDTEEDLKKVTEFLNSSE